MFDSPEDQLYVLKPEKLQVFFEDILKAPFKPEILADCKVSDLIIFFSEEKNREKADIYFSEEDSGYVFTGDAVSKFMALYMDNLVTQTMNVLIEAGIVDTYWDSKKNDFVFRLI